MDRRGFLQAAALGGLAIGWAGCARTRPLQPDETPDVPALRVGHDGTPAGTVIAQLYAGALAGAGHPAEVVKQNAATAVVAIASGDLDAFPGYAASLLTGLLGESEPPAPAEVIPTLAGEVSPAVSLIATSAVDAGLFAAVSPRTAGSGLRDLRDLVGRKDVVVASPAAGLTSAAGVPALKVAYGATFETTTVEPVLQRRQAVLDQTATLGFFREVDTIEMDGLVRLGDSLGIAAPDPLAALFASGLADSAPQGVLALSAVMTALTVPEFTALRQAARSDRNAAQAWLVAKGLA